VSGISRVLVIGASGLLGRPLAKAFKQRGLTVRVMARDRERLVRMFGDGYEIAAGSAEEPRVVDEAIAGCDGVHICVAHRGDETAAVDCVVRAAKRVNVRRVSYVSGTSVCEANAWFPMVGAKLRAERIVSESGLPWTIFRPTWFMDTVINFVHDGRAVSFGKTPLLLHLVSSEDFAGVVSRAYASPEAENRAFRVLGPEAIDLYDAIDRYRRAMHPEIAKVTRIPFWMAALIARFRGRAGADMAAAVKFVRYFQGITEGAPDPDTERLLGPCPTTFDAWLGVLKSR
jgi:uncharacterized protein YbjT (DUF2867 family)